jgi:hypothetical protein
MFWSEYTMSYAPSVTGLREPVVLLPDVRKS